MIRELVIGTLLLGGGGGYYLVSRDSADIVRTVSASPHDTWRGFDRIMNAQEPAHIGYGPDGFEPGKGLSWPQVTSIDSKEIDYRVRKDGAEAIRLRLRFEPLEGGRKTKLLFDADFSGDIAMAKYSPQVRVAMTRVLDEFIRQIETGRIPQGSEGFEAISARMVADPHAGEAEQRQQAYARREAQREAARPELDPNKARMRPVGQSVRPARPNPDY